MASSSQNPCWLSYQCLNFAHGTWIRRVVVSLLYNSAVMNAKFGVQDII